MCFFAGAMMVPYFLALNGFPNPLLLAALIIPAFVAGLIVYALRRFVSVRLAIAVGVIFVLIAVGLTGWNEWGCQSEMHRPYTQLDNDGTVRILMLLGGYLAWSSVVFCVGVAIALFLPSRRPASAGHK